MTQTEGARETTDQQVDDSDSNSTDGPTRKEEQTQKHVRGG